MDFPLKHLPKEETLRKHAERFPELDISAIQSCLRVMQVGSDVQRAFEAGYARHGLSRGRFLLMMMLLRHAEGLRPAELAEVMGVTRATVTGLMAGLEKEGLILRREHAEDGRMALVRLSARGRQKLEGMLPDHYRRTAALMSGLSSAERQQLLALMDKMAAGIGHMRDP
ncbi:MarR family transcriptional regulator [Myxococcaceae bacterium GXIMD 01537]